MDQEPNGAAAMSGTSPLQNGLHSSSSFLTKAQQAALDSALEKKEKAASACSIVWTGTYRSASIG